MVTYIYLLSWMWRRYTRSWYSAFNLTISARRLFCWEILNWLRKSSFPIRMSQPGWSPPTAVLICSMEWSSTAVKILFLVFLKFYSFDYFSSSVKYSIVKVTYRWVILSKRWVIANEVCSPSHRNRRENFPKVKRKSFWNSNMKEYHFMKNLWNN